jgi:indolepyruvate ferredoxin oxidoreductase beta subunit
MLPAPIAARLVAWERARHARGRVPLALAVHLHTDTITGFLALRWLSGRKGLRRRGARYAQEQTGMERWLCAIVTSAKADWSCAYEIALCGRLVKGYGATNERGKQHLSHILEYLAVGGAYADPAARSAALRAAREAALADEGGLALDRALAAHGAPPRPVAAQPIRWMRRPATTATPSTTAK